MDKPMSEQMQKLAERYERATGKKFDQKIRAEVVYVVHGKWVAEDDYFCCSKCGQAINEACVPWFHYCPNCGARMDGERYEND